jgi:hypothetical protein
MRRLNVALIGFLAVGVAAMGCGGGAAEAEGEEGAPVVEMSAPTTQLRPLLDQVETDTRLVAVLRGPGQIGYLPPRSTRQGGDIVTTFTIQNTSTSPLAGFKVNEFWYDDNGDTLTGGQYRMKRPLFTDEVVQVTLRVPRNARATRSNYEFSHQGGEVAATEFEEMAEPTAIVEDGVLTEVVPEEEEEEEEAP